MNELLSNTELLDQASMTAKEYAYKAIYFAREQKGLTDAQAQIASAMIVAASLDYLAGVISQKAD